MRADRLLAQLMIIQRTGHVTAAHLAEQLEVSLRTIYRDWEALRVAGVPLITDSGPGGGCRLYGDWRSELTGMTPGELEALALLAATNPTGVVGEPLTTALAKLGAAVPEAYRLPGGRVIVDTTGQSPATDTVRVLMRAVNSDAEVRLGLRRLFDTLVERIARPLGLVSQEGAWHLVWTADDERARVDRLTHIVSVEQTGASFTRPAGWNLEHFWHNHRLAIERSRRGFTATLAAAEEVLPTLRRRYRDMREANGEIDIRFRDMIEARSAILSLGGAVEVLAPDALRRSVVDFAEQTVRRHAEGRLVESG